MGTTKNEKQERRGNAERKEGGKRGIEERTIEKSIPEMMTETNKGEKGTRKENINQE